METAERVTDESAFELINIQHRQAKGSDLAVG